MDDGYRTKKRYGAALVALGAGAACGLLAAERADADCAQPASAPPVCLSGTITAKAHDSALVEATGVPGSEWLHAGDAVNGWTIVEIGSGYIVIERKGQRARLEPAGQAGIVDVADRSPARAAAVPAALKRGPMQRSRAWEARGERPAPE